MSDEMKKLEEALELCRFGRFHIRLLLASLAGFMSASVNSTTSSFVLTNAECDLNLNQMQKGLVIAAPFMGQVILSFIAGIVADAFGRKPCLVYGYCVMFVCCIIEGSSQTFFMLLFSKLFAGMALCFCFNGVGTMLAELTHKGLRDRVMLIGMTFGPFTQIMVVVLAWAVLPHRWTFVLWKGYFVLHSWNIYTYVCAIFSLLAALQFYYLPESPKYLLAHRSHDKALQNLKKIYKENTGQPVESFPIKSLTNCPETLKIEKLTFKEHLAGASSCVKELFKPPLLCPLFLTCAICFCILSTTSAVRLWYPQFSTIIENYRREHNETTYFCTMIDSFFKNGQSNQSIPVVSDIQETVCVPIISGPETYYNSIFIYFLPAVILIASVLLVNCFGQKPLTFISIVSAASTLSGLFWAKTPLQVASIVALTNAFNNAQYFLLSSMTLRIFPTTSRSIAMALSLMSGRIGSLFGNILLPALLGLGCSVPFEAMIIAIMFSAVLVCFLPNPSKENKETGDG